MEASTDVATGDPARVRELIAADRHAVYRRTDRLFARLLGFEWAVCVCLAVWVSPVAWAGDGRAVHPHVWAALALGLAVVALPVWLVVVEPGRLRTRLAVGAAQMLMSALLIHLTGGRPETHFHVFGSLAFLAFYRDLRVLLVASAVAAADHLVRGMLWPESVYGTAVGADWRWAEHAGWVLFLDVFLVQAGRHSLRDAARAAERQAAVEAANVTVERKVADRTRQLWESEERFRSAFDHAALGMAICAPDGRFIQVNHWICELTGFDEAELLARRFTDLTHPDDRPGDVEPGRRLMAGEDRTYRREKRYVRKDGRTIWVRVNASVVRGPDGVPIHTVRQILDVTEQREAERSQRDAAARLKAVVDQAAEGIVTADDGGVIESANPAAEAQFGYPSAELVGLPVGRLLPAAGGAGLLRPEGGGAVHGRETTGRRRDGTEFPVSLSVSEVRLANRRLYTAIVRDISAQKRAEDELRAAQASARKLSLVAQHTQNAVVITDAGGRIEWVNDGFERLTGYPLAEVAGRKPGAFLQGPGTDPATVAHVRDRLAAGRGFDVEVLNYARDGRAYWLAIECRPVCDDGGRVTNFVAVESDVTARREAARALEEAKAAAEAASKSKSEFLANMSHEIRTPMNGILGMTDLLLETDLSREQRESLGLVRSSADALLGVINDILDFSKIEAGKLDLDPTPLFLRDVVADTLKPLAFPAHAKGLELACDLRPEVPDLAVGDPVRLRQVLTNLVGNAVKFTAKGEVVVRGELVEEAADGFRVRFGVTDTGIGIPAGKLATIFDPFTQADGSTTRRFGGSGLGLTICARLVEMMGGRIWVESELGKGSTFFFEVKLERARVSAERPVPMSADVRDMAVLVVDDNATNRRVLEDTLKNWAARPVSAEDGPAALAELRRAAAAGAPYPLVLLDAMMPGMDGFRVAEQVGREPAIAGAAILMLTSADAAGDAARCRDLGLSAYLVKPVKASELNAAIAAALPAGPGAARAGGSVLVAPDGRLLADPEPSPAGPGLRVLVAEDNAVNQKVITRLLEKYGHKAVLANHGGEAIAALDREAFDVVFMDVQMPEVDGFAASRVIRDREAAGVLYPTTVGGAWPRLPIVAMTAHAMKGDRERCLAGGMDDYVSKPVQRPELLRVLAWATSLKIEDRRSEIEEKATPVVLQSPIDDLQSSIPALEREVAIDRLGGDEELFAEVAALFLADAPRMVADIRRAAEAGDPGTLQRAAHTLKGAAGYVGGSAAAAAAHQVEQLATAGDFAAVAAPIAAVARETDRLRAALTVTLTPAPAA